MIQTPAIVTFANQKGGVGKTTLYATFANYLVTKGVRVVVVDCDYQHSIAKCRRADIRKYGNQTIPYNVSEFLPNDKDTMTQLTAKLHNDPSIEIALMDSPGSLNAAGLVPLFCNSDIIVIPFHYDLVTVPTTSNFLMFIDRLRKATGGKMSTRLFIVPNSHDNRVGTRSELLLWDETRDTFSNYGIVTPKIAKRADMQRFTTMAGLDTQLPFVQKAFDKIYSEIFDNTEPRRKVELTGIQLVPTSLRINPRKPISRRSCKENTVRKRRMRKKHLQKRHPRKRTLRKLLTKSQAIKKRTARRKKHNKTI